MYLYLYLYTETNTGKNTDTNADTNVDKNTDTNRKECERTNLHSFVTFFSEPNQKEPVGWPPSFREKISESFLGRKFSGRKPLKVSLLSRSRPHLQTGKCQINLSFLRYFGFKWFDFRWGHVNLIIWSPMDWGAKINRKTNFEASVLLAWLSKAQYGKCEKSARVAKTQKVVEKMKVGPIIDVCCALNNLLF